MGSTPPNADHSSLSQRLHILARNLWWTWNPEAQAIFQDLSPQVWQQSNHNAVEVLNEVSSVELQARLHDQEFMKKVQFVLEEFEDYLKDKSTWVSRNVPALMNPIVYFSAEFGLHESLPIYSGGLGVLSGDHTKSASDLGLPFIGIGLYYRKGYFQQRIGNEGWQEEQYPVWPPEHLPLELVSLPEGGRLLNSVEIGDVTVYFQTWRLNVGRTVVYLLDTCVPENSEHYQGLTASVYGGNIDTRIGQEVVLGIGGVRLLKSMGVTPSCYHMNEGHSAFLVLELLLAETNRHELLGVDVKLLDQEALHRLGAAVGEHVLVILRREQRVDGDRHDTRLDRAEERHRPVDGVVHRNQDAVFHPEAQRQQVVAEAVHPLGEIAEAALARIVDVGGLCAPPGLQVPADQVLGRVVNAWNVA